MKIKSISISRRASYEMKEGDRFEFKASIDIEGQSGYDPQIKITLSKEQLEPIVGIVAQAVAHNMEASAKAFHEEVQAALAGPVVEQIEADPTHVEEV